MSHAVDILGERVVAAADLIASLRLKLQALERELLTIRVTNTVPASASPADSPQPVPADELERLRAERVVVREGIRELLREIDRISW